MNQVTKTTLRLTIIYSIVFFVFIWSFSAGIYLWTNNSFGEGYLNHINELVEGSDGGGSNKELSDHAATVAADVALDQLRNIIVVVNFIGFVLIPLLAYQLSKRSLRPLVKSQEEQRAFIANASHELRTPLAVISGELELGGKPGKTKEEYQQTIAHTSREVSRMTNLVHELLYLSRISSESKLQNIKKINITKLLNEVVELYEPKAKERGIHIKLSQHLSNKQISGHYELLTAAVGNLLDNAIKFSSKQSIILIEVEERPGELRLSIKNRGPQIPKEKIKNLFERFYQTEPSHSAQGYGLGLAIAKRAVDLHGGKIEVVSDKNLTTFAIILALK
ncbi:MAG: Signal transduction histidine kinase [Candidatus Saccharibacteria bacterium]|jgi:two-component system sensor histidine kinase CiaH|nr:Signal transduction histidine kinase [Candidatus Saccharibacteria bacterium]